MPTTVADQVAGVLKASGVRRVYGLPGDSLNGLTDAIRRDGGLTWEHVRHEEAAAFAAGGEAAATGHLAVCAASCGPGNLHLINGLYDANRSRVPVLAIAAHIPREEIGGGYFQETHPQELFRECSVISELVSVPAQLPRLLEIAIRTAIERRGVAVLVVPGEVFLAQADLPYREFDPENVPGVQVDVSGEQIGRRAHVDVPLVGTVRDTAAALVSLLRPDRDEAHLQRMLAHYRRTRRRLDALAEESASGARIHPQSVAAAIDRLATEDAAFLADVGTPVVWAARHLRMNGRRRLIGSFAHGTMANALPQAIGVQASHPGRQVITLSGDGGLGMLLGELITLRQLRLPVKVVVFDNSALAFVELEMKAAGIVNFGTGLENPDFSSVARSLGLYGVRVERPEELEDGLRAALDHRGPAVVDVLTARHELSLPPRITLKQAGGFALWATRSVLSGRGDHFVELARTNVRQLELEGL
jgi:thiamine pyrophosphate-dependent acetolactate synthase large subunit-like protein